MAEVKAGDVKLHVQRLGQGEPTVVFLHGLVMDNLSSWYFSVATHVAAHCRVVLYDLRGHGMSTMAPAGYRLDDMVADLDAVLDGLAVTGPVRIVGNSFGGLLALCYAIDRPARVAGLALVDGLVPTPGWADAMTATLSLDGDARDHRIAESFKAWIGRHSERKRNRLADQARRLVKGTTLLTDLAASGGRSDRQLAAITCPVLAIYGEQSDQRTAGERLAALLPRCELVLLPGCSHSVLWEQTVRVRKMLLDWARGGG